MVRLHAKIFQTLLLVATLVFTGTMGGGCSRGTTRETLASVLSLDGTAEISADGGRAFSPLRLSDTLGQGAIVRTAPGSRLSLALLPNCLVQLDSNTSAEIGRLALTKDGNETGSDVRARFAEIKLNNGRIFASHVWGGALAHFSVATAGGNASTPSNATFWVEFTSGKTRVTCATGGIEFRPSDAPESIRVPPGSTGQWPSANGNITGADADSHGQDDLQKAIELEQELRSLVMQKRNALPR